LPNAVASATLTAELFEVSPALVVLELVGETLHGEECSSNEVLTRGERGTSSIADGFLTKRQAPLMWL
jgi:hypothetical protein